MHTLEGRRFLGILATLAAFLIISGSAAAQEKGPITVGSKIDTEGSLLGQIILLMLEENDFGVEDKTEFGPTPIVRKAITSGEIDIYPDYTGNGAFYFSSQDSTIWKDHARAYEAVNKMDYEANRLVWLTPSPANNTWAMAVRGELAQTEDLQTLEDFAAYVNNGGEVKLAACEEFVSREDALPSFEKAYGFDLQDEQMIVFSGCNTAQTEKAAAQNISGVNTAMAFGTDGPVAALGLVLLEDTKNVQPVYAPAPVIRKEVINIHPEIESILAPVFATLDQETLQQLNARIAIGGENAKAVARDYLEKKGLL